MRKKAISLLLALLMLLSLLPAAAFADDGAQEGAQEETLLTGEPAEGQEPETPEAPPANRGVEAGEGETGEVTEYWTITLDAGSTGYFYFDGNNEPVRQQTIQVVRGSANYSYYEAYSEDLKLRFRGWFTGPDGSGEQIDLYEYVPTGDVTLYAGWKNVYTVKLDANGGSFENGASTWTLSPIAEGDCFYGDNAVMTHSDEHMAFVGWYYDAACTDFACGRYDWFYPTEDVTLYAGWEQGWIVTLDANGGYYYGENNEHEGQRSYRVPAGSSLGSYYAPNPEDNRHMCFAGWNENADGSGEMVYNLSEYVPTGDVTFYAVWSARHIVTVYANGGYYWDGSNQLEQMQYLVEAGESFGLRNYSARPEHSDPHMAVEALYYDAAFMSLACMADESFVPEGDVTLYVKWTEGYLVTLDAGSNGYFYISNGVPVRQQQYTVVPGSSLDSVPWPSHEDEHMNYGGWSLNADGSEAVDPYSYVPAGDVTLYVLWEPRVFVTLDANGGFFWNDPNSTTYRISVSADGAFYPFSGSLPTHSDAHMAIEGWYYDAACTQPACGQGGSVALSGDTTLYAKWISGYVVTLDAGSTGYFSQSNDEYIRQYCIAVAPGASVSTYSTPGNEDEHLRFDGWFTGPGGSGEAIDLYGYVPTGDVTLYAGWTQFYRITFDANGGCFYGDPEHTQESWTVNAGEACRPGNYTGPQHSDPHMTVEGWYYDAAFMSPACAVDGSFVPEGDVTLYAKWTEGYLVTLDAGSTGYFGYDNGVAIRQRSYAVMPGSSLGFSTGCSNEDNHMIFEGWYENPDFSGEPINSLDEYVPSGDVTLYARWSYYALVTADANGGYFGREEDHATTSSTWVTPGNEFTMSYLTTNVHHSDPHMAVEGWYYDAACTNFACGPRDYFSVDTDTTLYAKWTEGYLVTLDAGSTGYFRYDAGVAIRQQSYAVTPGGSLTTNPAPGNENEELGFTGWYLNADGSGDSIDLWNYVPTGDVTLYAGWRQVYRITFDANGGYFYGDVTDTERTWTINAGEVCRVGNYARPQHSDPSMAVEGWYFDAACTQLACSPSGSFTPSGSVTLYAKWVTGYVVTLDAGEGYFYVGGETSPQMRLTVAPGETVGSNYTPSTDAGLEFGGWFVDPDFSGSSIYLRGYVPTGDVTLYARWLRNNTVTFNANGGRFENGETTRLVSLTEGYAFSNNDGRGVTHENLHLAFSGWYLDAACTQLASTDGNSAYVPAGDVTVYAGWGPGWLVTFDANGGVFDGGAATQTFTVLAGDRVQREPYPHSNDENLTSAGWYLTPDCSGQRVSPYSYKPTGDVTFYAGWEKVLTLNFHANGGYFQREEQTDTVTERQPESSYISYDYGVRNENPRLVFSGWYADAACTQLIVAYDDGVQLHEDSDLYAGWTEGWIVTFDANGGSFPEYDGAAQFTIGARKNERFSYSIPYVTHADGYVLDGWYLTPDCSGESVGELYEYVIRRDQTLYAKWVPLCTVTLNANGGYFWEGPEVTTYTYRTVSGGTVPVIGGLTNADPSLVFAGWYYDAACTQPAFDAERVTHVNGDVTLYAGWDAAAVLQLGRNTVMLYQSGSQALFTPTVSGLYALRSVCDENVYLNASIAILNGEIFDWAYGSGRNFLLAVELEAGVTYLLRFGNETEVYDSHRYYGPITIEVAATQAFQITYDFNGVIPSYEDPVMVRPAYAGVPISNAPVNSRSADWEQILTGWYFDPACTQLAIDSDHDFTPTGDTTLYAKWELYPRLAEGRNQLNMNGSYVEASFTPTVSGYYVFESEGTSGLFGVVYRGQTGPAAAKPGTGPGENFRFCFMLTGGREYSLYIGTVDNSVFSGPVTVNVYRSSAVTLTYRANGGYFGNDTLLDTYEVTMPAGATVEVLPPVANSGGQAFCGWYLDEACTQLAFTGRGQFAPTADTTLYAKWGEALNGLQLDATGWHYYKNGAVDTSFTGLVLSEQIGWWYVENGAITFSYTGLAYGETIGWWYVTDSQLRWDYTGIAYRADIGYWYCENSQITFAYNGTVTQDGVTYDVVNSQATPRQAAIPDGLQLDATGWHYYKNGAVDTSFTGLAYSDQIGWWYVENGAITFSHTGLVCDPNIGWWYVENSQITFSKTGLVCDEQIGWWYVTNSAIDFGKTGLVLDPVIGWWYVEGGRITFSTTGLVCDPAMGWWYVVNSQLSFETRIVNDPAIGTWYVENGAIAFGFTGTVEYAGETWNVVGGQASKA